MQSDMLRKKLLHPCCGLAFGHKGRQRWMQVQVFSDIKYNTSISTETNNKNEHRINACDKLNIGNIQLTTAAKDKRHKELTELNKGA